MKDTERGGKSLEIAPVRRRNTETSRFVVRKRIKRSKYENEGCYGDSPDSGCTHEKAYRCVRRERPRAAPVRVGFRAGGGARRGASRRARTRPARTKLGAGFDGRLGARFGPARGLSRGAPLTNRPSSVLSVEHASTARAGRRGVPITREGNVLQEAFVKDLGTRLARGYRTRYRPPADTGLTDTGLARHPFRYEHTEIQHRRTSTDTHPQRYAAVFVPPARLTGAPHRRRARQAGIRFECRAGCSGLGIWLGLWSGLGAW